MTAEHLNRLQQKIKTHESQAIFMHCPAPLVSQQIAEGYLSDITDFDF